MTTFTQNAFTDKLRETQRRNRSWVCVGLDPVMQRLPEAVLSHDDPLLAFAQAIVEATADMVCAYKPNLAFWLAEGPAGLHALKRVIDCITDLPDHPPVILDAKFNDVAHTAAAYARTAFETLGADAVTANPYLGVDALRPFLAHESHGVFLLARTSNPSAVEVQDLPVGERPLYEVIARLTVQWNAEHPGTCGLVVGATYPDELARLREIAPSLPFLVPGAGAQGGDLPVAVAHGPTADDLGPVINSSRGILYASSGPDFAAAARTAAQTLRDQINHLRGPQ
jgi:orotidine-5'-phosphate decarboxylase